MGGVTAGDMARCCRAARACRPSGARGWDAAPPPGAPAAPERARSAAPGAPSALRAPGRAAIPRRCGVGQARKLALSAPQEAS